MSTIGFILVCAFSFSAFGAATPVDSGVIFQYNGDYGKAQTWYRALLDRYPDSLALHRAYQDACFARGHDHRDSAAAWYRRYREQKPGDPVRAYLYGRCLDCKEGAAVFDRAILDNACNVWLLNGRGACSFERGDFDSAKADFGRSIRCDLSFAQAYQNLAQVYQKQGKHDLARKTYRTLISRGSGTALSYEWLGDNYLSRGETAVARKAYTKAVELGAAGPGVLFKLGYAWFKAGDRLQAVSWYKKSVAAGNRRYEVYFNLGSTFEVLNVPGEAIEWYAKAFAAGGDYKVLYAMGNCAVLTGLYSKALECYRAFLEKEPRNTEALLGLANACRMKGDYDMAIGTYQKIIEIDPGFSKAYFNLGSIYAYHLKQPGRMKEYWGKYISLFPKNDDVSYVKTEMNKLAAKAAGQEE